MRAAPSSSSGSSGASTKTARSNPNRRTPTHSCRTQALLASSKLSCKGGTVMYAIAGVTGNTGRVVAEKLLANGKQVRVIGRDSSRLAHFIQKGAEVIAADLTDPVRLARAFEGARAAYVL